MSRVEPQGFDLVMLGVAKEVFLFLALFNYSVLILMPAAVFESVSGSRFLFSMLGSLIVARVLLYFPAQFRLISQVASTPAKDFNTRRLKGLLMVNLCFLAVWGLIGLHTQLGETFGWTLAIVPAIVFVIYLQWEGFDLLVDPDKDY